mmetsp:Transcript_1052/g.1593  ORF Transcript_1052/g.1593 Transcript_1052/m.1593 type:complete len:134 (-) Transcript_1052:101-502(-)
MSSTKILLKAIISSVLLSTLGCLDNNPIAPNVLGKISQVCSANLCKGNKDSLALWLEMNSVCHAPNIDQIEENFRSQFPQKMYSEIESEQEVLMWSSFLVGVICTISVFVGLSIGFNSGSKMGLKYSESANCI